MAQQTIGIGTSANDGTGDPLRTAFDKTNDNFTENYASIAAIEGAAITADTLLRASNSASANGTVGQTISYTSAFTASAVVIITDPNGLGIEVTAQDANGFTITSLSSGTFGYVSLIEN